MITESVYKELLASGCLPSILYGLPKVKKLGFLIRPVFSPCNIPAYRLAKFLFAATGSIAGV